MDDDLGVPLFQETTICDGDDFPKSMDEMDEMDEGCEANS